MALIFSGGLGLIIGSFINVLTLRFSPDEPNRFNKALHGRSYCPHCHRQLAWFELIPIFSFICLRGRCRTCHAKISWQYPIVEFSTALIFVVLAWKILNFNFLSYYLFVKPEIYFWAPLLALLWFFFVSVLISISVIDIRHYIIPDKITIFSSVVAFLASIGFFVLGKFPQLNFPKYSLNFLGPFLDPFILSINPILYYLIGALLLSGFLFLIFIITKGRGIGFGDVKLAFLIGLMLGPISGVAAVLLSFIIGSFVGIFLIFSGKKKLKGAIPFGPFLSLGVLSVVIFGETIVKFYLSLFPN
ncbi:MAG TPA: prepilin peptidase [Candidatus Paceibacterota bacterium]|nr:prepilin peptidase [Candidatus Paceibacterota bacterium]